MGRSGNLSQIMCPKNIFEKNGSLSKSWGNLFDFCQVLKGRSFCKAGPGTCHKKCALAFPAQPEGVVQFPPNTPWGLSSFCWVLQGRSLVRSGPEAVHKKCAQGAFWEKWKAGSTHAGTHPVFRGSCRGGHFPGQAPKLFTENVSKKLFGKSGRQVQHLKGPIQFLSGLARKATFQVRPQSCSQKMCLGGFLGKVESNFNTCGDPSSFLWVLQGRSLSRSGPEVVHKKCVQRTFWEKWKAGSAPAGTYPVFVWLCKGGHFPGQAPELCTRNVLKGLFWKSGMQVQHLRGPSQFLLGPAGEVTFQVRPRSCPREMCPRDFSEKVGGRFNTWGDLASFCWVLQGRSFSRSDPGAVHKKCVQGTFGEKCTAGPTPEGTYPVFVGSCRGGHFPTCIFL